MACKLSRFTVWGGVGVLALMICGYGTIMWIVPRFSGAVFPWSILNNQQLVLELVSARGLGSITLVIPEAYVYSLPNPNGKKQDTIILQAALPDMKPWRGAGQSRATYQRVYIKAWYRQRVVESAIIPKEILGEKIYHGTTDDGFLLYKRPSPSSNDRLVLDYAQREYLIPLNISSAQATVFECAPDSPDRPPNSIGCTADTDIGDNLHVEYTFRRAHLRDWQELDKKIRGLFESFIRKSVGDG